MDEGRVQKLTGEGVTRSERIESSLDAVSTLRVLVVGDVILDEYRIGEVDRVSPEAPVPIVHVSRSESNLGGAANVARAVISLGAGCRLVGLVGEDAEGDAIHSLVDQLGLSTSGLIRSPDRPTTHKIRVVARGQQMLRLDREDESPIEANLSEQFRAVIREQIRDCDVVVLEDYDKGIFGEGLAHWVIERARAQGAFVVADPKTELGRFRGASLVKPNLGEAMRFVAGHGASFTARRKMLEKLQHQLGGGEVVVTRGRAGMSGLDEKGNGFDVPTRALEVYDVQGAGDTSVAALGLCRVAGASLLEACIVANAAAAVAVEKVGTAAVGQAELRRRLPEVIAAYEELA